MAVKKILRCLETKNGCGIHYVRCDIDLRAFSDADWKLIPMIEDLLLVLLKFWVLILSHDPLRNNKLRFVLLLELNIGLRHPLLLNYT